MLSGGSNGGGVYVGTSCSYQEPFKHSKYLRLHVGRCWCTTSTECNDTREKNEIKSDCTIRISAWKDLVEWPACLLTRLGNVVAASTRSFALHSIRLNKSLNIRNGLVQLCVPVFFFFFRCFRVRVCASVRVCEQSFFLFFLFISLLFLHHRIRRGILYFIFYELPCGCIPARLEHPTDQASTTNIIIKFNNIHDRIS